jgi:hypothetical protein
MPALASARAAVAPAGPAPTTSTRARWGEEEAIISDKLLRTRPGCGIVEPVPTRIKPFLMRPASPSFRAVMTAGTAVLLWLLSVSVSEAAHPHQRRVRRVCDPQRTTIQQLRRKPITYGGPLAQPSQRALAGLTDPMARLVRTRTAVSDDDDAVIQNDAPPATTVSDLPVELQPLGLFVEAFEPRALTRAFSPRSPRGPPVSA